MNSGELLRACLERKSKRTDYLIFSPEDYNFTEYREFSQLVKEWVNHKVMGRSQTYNSGEFFDHHEGKRYFFISWSKRGRAMFLIDIEVRKSGQKAVIIAI